MAWPDGATFYRGTRMLLGRGTKGERWGRRALGVLALLLLLPSLMPAAAQTPVKATLAASGAAAGVHVTGARLGIHEDKTRLVLDLTGAIGWRAATSLVGPGGRITLDLPGAAAFASPLPNARGVVTSIRMEGVGNVLRLVLDTSRPVRVAWGALLPPQDGKGPRFVLDLAPVERSGFKAESLGPAVSLTPASGVAIAPPVAPPSQKAAPVPARPMPTVVPAAISGMGAVPVPRSKPSAPKLPLVVIDPGHGGQDPGAIAVNGLHEKDITLAMAQEMRRRLEATGRYRVALTRERDVFLRLRDRVAKARDLGADLFISLHADSIDKKGVRGLSVYTLSDKATDREAEMLAQRENRADSIAGMDLRGEADEVVSILIDLAQRDTRNQALRLASLVVREAGREVALLPGPQRSAGFAVLTAPDMPSVLIEMGYLSDPKDARLLASGKHRERLATALVRAVDAYFGVAVRLSAS